MVNITLVYTLAFADEWDEYFKNYNSQTQTELWKKVLQLKQPHIARHLKHGLAYFVVEAGQYRICFKQETTVRTIYFVGNHKQYEKWYKNCK